ncbi:hypothetical protein IKW72_03225 [bacterium]|nr:hypothetical protein [bacterium]
MALIPVCYILYALLPPLFANNFIFQDHLARKISKATGKRAEVVGFSLSSWTGPFKIEITALDLYETKDNGKMVVSLDHLKCKMLPWQILPPFFALREGNIRVLEWCRAGENIKKALRSLPYFPLEKWPLWEDESRSAEFHSVRFDLKKEQGALLFSFTSDVDCPNLSESELSSRGRFYPASKVLLLNELKFSGRSRSLCRSIKDGKIVEDAYDIPFVLTCDLELEKDRTEIKNISFLADRFLSTGRISRSAEEFSFLLNGTGYFSQELAQLCGLNRRVSYFKELDCQVKGSAAPGQKLKTEGEGRFKEGQITGLSLENAQLTFSALDDRLTSLDLSSSFWQGVVNLKAKESKIGKENTLLKASFEIKEASASDMLEYFKCRGRMPGGTISLYSEVFLTNGTLTAILSNGEETLRSLYGSGKISASNVDLAYFAKDDFLNGSAPLVLQRVLGSGATLASAKEKLPFLQQIMQSLSKEKLKNYSASFRIKDGAIISPVTKLNGALGQMEASGRCQLSGEVDYSLKLILNQALSSKYAKQPLASLFLENGLIVLPIKMQGDLREPKISLDLSEEKKGLFEDRVLQLVTEFYNDKLRGAAGRFLGEGESGDLMQKIEDSVKELLKKLL